MNNHPHEWQTICDVLGEERTAKLTSNGTSVEVARQMAEQVLEFRQRHPILFQHD